MRSLRLAAPLVTAALAVSCTERTGPSDVARPTPPVSYDFINGPGSPGNSGIFRYQDNYFFGVFVDESSGLITIQGLENTVADLCAGLGEFALVDFQLKPQNAGEVNSLLVALSSPVQILALPAESSGDFCEDFSGAPVLYSGTVALHRTDNNFTETGSEGGRADSFGWSAHGVLDDLVNGGEVQYSETLRALINPQTGELRVLVANIRVH
jgi:hypothetical protein